MEKKKNVDEREDFMSKNPDDMTIEEKKRYFDEISKIETPGL